MVLPFLLTQMVAKLTLEGFTLESKAFEVLEGRRYLVLLPLRGSELCLVSSPCPGGRTLCTVQCSMWMRGTGRLPSLVCLSEHPECSDHVRGELGNL